MLPMGSVQYDCLNGGRQERLVRIDIETRLLREVNRIKCNENAIRSTTLK